MLGEVNDDGVIDAIDASAILTEYALTSVGRDPSFTDGQQKAADVNLDGIVDATDASTVLTYYAYVSVNDNMTLEEYLKKFVFEETDPEPEEPELNEDQEQFAILLSESIDEPFVIYKDLFVPNLTKIEFGMKKSEFEEKGFTLTGGEDFDYWGYSAKLYYAYDSNNRVMNVFFNSDDELSEIVFDEETSREDFSEIADVFDNIFDKQFVVYELDNGQYEYAYIDSETNSSWSLYNEIYLDTNEYHFRQHLRAGNLCK